MQSGPQEPSQQPQQSSSDPQAPPQPAQPRYNEAYYLEVYHEAYNDAYRAAYREVYSDAYRDAYDDVPDDDDDADDDVNYRVLELDSPDFTGRACLTLFLYCLFYVPGLIANIVYLREADRVRKQTGRVPSGDGCLLTLMGVGIMFGIIFGI